MPRRSLALDLLWVSSISLASTLPFLDKAFHIDDVLYLLVARQILETPWDPYGEATSPRSLVLWDAKDGRPESLFDTNYNPPLWNYVLAGGISLWGESERALHLLSACWAWGAALGVYFLARRLTDRPIWTTAMVIWGPFFLPGQNLMLEVPVLFMSSWSAVLIWRSWDDNTRWPALAAGLLVGLGVLTKYSVSVLIPIYLVGTLIHRRWNALWFLMSASFVIGAWFVHNTILYGRPHMPSHGVLFEYLQWPGRALTVLRIVGGVSFLGPIWWSAIAKQNHGGLKLAIIAGLSLGVGFLDRWQAARFYGEIQQPFVPTLQAFFVVMTTLGTATLLGWIFTVLLRPKHVPWKKEDLVLDVWILALLAFNTACVPFNAVRHLLLGFVALCLRSARMAPVDARWSTGLSLSVSSLLAFAIAFSDYEFAGAYRAVAQTTLRDDISQLAAKGNRVWFTGHWGWFYYASKEGALPYFEGGEEFGLGVVVPGDRIYHPLLVNWALFDRHDNLVRMNRELRPDALIPVRTIMAGAHYYGLMTHTLPWEVITFNPGRGEGVDRTAFPPIDVFWLFDVEGKIR